MLEIANAPNSLGDFVALIGERHDHVVVGLGYGPTVAGEALDAFAVGRANRFIETRSFGFDPGEKRGAEVEADFRIIVDDVDDVLIAIKNAAGGVGRVAFRGDALVPIVIGISGILNFDGLKPGIFARRLVKMRVNAEVTLFHVERDSLMTAIMKMSAQSERMIRKTRIRHPCLQMKILDKGRGEIF